MNRFDLSKPNCHVCGKPLKRSFAAQTERCINTKCDLYRVGFSIPYKIKKKSDRATAAVTGK